jgi:cell shape-determining protein MreD
LTPASGAFWIYLAGYSSLAGITALVLGLIARFTARPFDTPRRCRVFGGLLAVVVLMAVIASALSYRLVTDAGAPVSLRVNSVVSPLLSAVVIFIVASGFPLSRILRRRG